jgi:hypothetical protein
MEQREEKPCFRYDPPSFSRGSDPGNRREPETTGRRSEMAKRTMVKKA